MNSVISLCAKDGHQFSAYLSEPVASTQEPVAGIVIIQEIFGITDHLKYIADEFSRLGYRAIVPALFDRIEPGLLLSYDQVEKGIELAGQCTDENILADIKAAMDHVTVNGKVAVIGYCLGGTFAHLSACRLQPSAAISYYGTRITESLNEQPACPTLYHFGELDPYVPPEHIQQIGDAYPDQAVYVYEGANHGFSCRDRASYHAASTELAWQRTTDFLADVFDH